MESILVAGGAGFIGSNFVRLALARTDARVVVLDRLTYAGNLASLDDVRSHPRFAFVQGDIADRALVAGLLRQHRPDAVVNLAAETHVDRSIDGPRAFVETNLVGTFELLDAARQHSSRSSPRAGPASGSSTSPPTRCTAPSAPTGRFSEESPYAPNSPYAASKAGADHLVRAYHETYRLSTLRHELLEQLRAVPVPGEADPADDAQRDRGPTAAALRRRRQRARLAPRRGPLRGAAPGAAGGRARRSVQRGGGRRADEPRDRGRDLRGARGDPPGGRRTPRWPRGASSATRDLRTFVADRPGHDRRYAVDATRLATELGWRPGAPVRGGIRSTVAWYLEHRAWCDDGPRREVRPGAPRPRGGVALASLIGAGGRAVRPVNIRSNPAFPGELRVAGTSTGARFS